VRFGVLIVGIISEMGTGQRVRQCCWRDIKKLGGSLVAGGLTWRTDECRSKFLMGVREDLSSTFHGKGTTFGLRFTTDGRARLQSCRERLNIMRLLPPRHFTRSSTTNGKGTTFSRVNTRQQRCGFSRRGVLYDLRDNDLLRKSFRVAIRGGSFGTLRLRSGQALKPCPSICSSAQKQVPRLHAIIRQRMIALRSE
jgi:hypothetical protein